MDIQFICGECGGTLEGKLDGTHYNGSTGITVRIEFCEKCKKDTADEAFKDGETTAKEDQA